MSRGNRNVMMRERGIRTFETQYRNTLDLGHPAERPVASAGDRRSQPRNRQMGFGGANVEGGDRGRGRWLLIEVHSTPECALCDGRSHSPSKFKGVDGDLRKIAAAVDRTS